MVIHNLALLICSRLEFEDGLPEHRNGKDDPNGQTCWIDRDTGIQAVQAFTYFGPVKREFQVAGRDEDLTPQNNGFSSTFELSNRIQDYKGHEICCRIWCLIA